MTVEVDALEVIIAAMKADAAVNAAAGGRIDDRHRYGQNSGDWSQSAAALTISPAAGLPLLSDNGAWRGVYSALCFGDTPYDAGVVLKALKTFTDTNARRVIAVTEGNALLYYAVLRGAARLVLIDDVRPDGGMPAYQVLIEALVADQTVI